MSIPTSFIDQLLDQTDIVDVIGRRIPLNKKDQIFGASAPFMMTQTHPWLLTKTSSFFIVLYVRNPVMRFIS